MQDLRKRGHSKHLGKICKRCGQGGLAWRFVETSQGNRWILTVPKLKAAHYCQFRFRNEKIN
jgi:hypothetical protein